MKMKQTLWLSLACLLCLSAGQAQADSITTLFNTGVNGSGVSLGDHSIFESHYTLIAPDLTSTPILTRDNSFGEYPVNFYTGTPDSLTSMWIGPHIDNNTQLLGPVGDYIYETTFNLGGFDPSTAQILGNWSTDNNGLHIILNGSIVDGFNTGIASFVDGFSPFLINSGFIANTNTLQFVVRNVDLGAGANATALRVEMSGTASTPVPEPASLLLLGSGLMGLAAWRRKHTA